jgi:zinc protease
MEPTSTINRSILRSLLLVLALLLSACTPIQRPPEPDSSGVHLSLDTTLPNDPRLRTGVLDNGLTYYIRHNEKPARRAELILAVNAGSLVEDDDQLGLAHFVEHMLFNGTERFPGNELIDFLADIGMQFGPDLNAYTRFDETVYMLHIPTDDHEIVARALDVLEDWAAYATFDPTELERERGVVVEEWRLGASDAQGRVRDQLLPLLLADSHYAVRDPIGDMEIVRTAPVSTLRRFYSDWYRPDLMAVIAVGDLDIDAVEQQIRDRFSTLPAPEQPRPLPSFSVPEHTEPQYLVIADPEQPYTAVEVLIKQPASATTTVADFRRNLVGSLFYQMLNARLDELTRQVEPPFVAAGAGQNGFVRPLDLTYFFADVHEDGIAAGLEALLVEIERVQRYGFTPGELERAGAIVLRNFEQAYREQDHSENWDFVSAYLDHFLSGRAISTAETNYRLAQAQLPEITLAEVNQRVEGLVANENRVVLVTAPVKEGLVLPDKQELAAIHTAVEASAIEPYADLTVDRPLIAEPPPPVAIIEEVEHPELGMVEFHLANGVRVLVKPTEFRQDEVVFAARSPGGLSLVDDEEFWAGWLSPAVVEQSGVGEFTTDELARLLAGKNVVVTPFVSTLYEGLYGSASPTDLTTLFQLIHLVATAPRMDAGGLAATQNRWLALLENRLLDPHNVLDDTLNRVLHGDNLRYRLPTAAEIRAIDQQQTAAVYQTRFADLDDMTFVFAGNLEVEDIKELAQRYLGSLPGLPTTESWLDQSLPLPAVSVAEQVFKGQEEQSVILLHFSGEAEPSEENDLRLVALRRLLGNLIDRELRERLGAIYANQVTSHLIVEPQGRYSVTIYLYCAPDRVDELVTAFFDLIGGLQERGPAATDVTRVNQQMLSDLEETLEQNQWWVNQILYYATASGRDLADLAALSSGADEVTAVTLQAAARDFLPQDRYIKVVLYPAAHDE